jgi:Ca-activated chloride channel family protein
LVVATVATLAGQAPQSQAPTIRSGTHTVSVYASVVDSTGRLVTGLTKDDFIVLDDGKPQDLTIFTGDEQPITIVIMLDRSGSVVQQYTQVRDAAEKFVSHLGDADRARIGSFSTAVRIDPEVFTSDRNELIRILHDDLLGPGPTPLWNAAGSAMNALRNETGRRVVLMFTDGYDNPLSSGMRVTLNEVRSRSRNEEVMLYGIGLAIDCAPLASVESASASWGGPLFQGRGGGGRGGGAGGGRGGGRGIPIGLPGGIGVRLPIPIPQRPPVIPRGPGAGGGIDPRGGDPWGRPLPGATTKPETPCEVTQPDAGLREVALDSGGGYFELHAADELGDTFARVADELHRQYLLGFSPQVLDGRTHRLEVRMRDSTLTVRSRKSYVAEGSK